MRRQRLCEATVLDMDDRERFRRTLLLILVGFILLLYLLGALSLWARRRFLRTPPAPSVVVRVETARTNACKFVLT
jgi:hypothetical protein